MKRIFVDKSKVGPSVILIDNEDDFHHIKDVLKMRVGDPIVISDSDQWEYICEISGIFRDEAEALIIDKQKFAAEPKLRVTLFQGIPKQGKMDLTVQKAVELGVSEIVPVFMDRTVVVDRGNFWKRVVRFKSISEEASKQCGRGIIPEIRQAALFSEIIQRLKSFPVIIFPYENEETTTIKDCLRTLSMNSQAPERMAVIIGPEGGFSNKEADILKGIGAESVSLGKTILRTETAGIVALAMCMYELEL